jgi:hypothetical protein
MTDIESGTIEFDAPFKYPIRMGAKRATIRPVEKGPYPVEGERVGFYSSKDIGPFALATITDRQKMTAEEIINHEFEHHRNYFSIAQFARAMTTFYEDLEVRFDTEFYVIYFEEVEFVND